MNSTSIRLSSSDPAAHKDHDNSKFRDIQTSGMLLLFDEQYLVKLNRSSSAQRFGIDFLQNSKGCVIEDIVPLSLADQSILRCCDPEPKTLNQT